ncbi:MAG: PD-(D/E)XK nuclease family protein [Saccharofermentans sp.]|nr:PD-(D/E)XK nuclease family protein [Saccharofermentans sp.]
MKTSLESFSKMLEDAAKIDIGPHRSKNFFEISRYPHYENVASSILAFYFDTNEEHGLGDLWLRSLIECYQNNAPDKDLDDVYSLSSFETVANGILREDVTPDRKRLDIIIPTHNDFVVAIENKIFSGVNNPFDLYSERINDQYEQSNKLEILLSLKTVTDASSKGIDKYGNEYDFINITYKDLLLCVQKNIGSYLSNANEKWLIYMNEFIKNINSLQEGNMEINKEWQSFLDENRTLISEYEKKMQDDQKAKSKLINNLKDKLLDRIGNEKSPTIPTVISVFGTQGSDTHTSLVIEIKRNKEETLIIEPYFINAGCEFKDFQHFGVLYLTAWVRQSKFREAGLDIIKNALTGKGITYTEREIKSKNWNWGKSIETDNFDFSKDVIKESVNKSL